MPAAKFRQGGAIFAAGVAVMVAIAQLGGWSLYYSWRVSSTHTSDQVSPRGEKTFELVSIDYPWSEWLPLVKFGETVIRHNYWHPDGRDTVERQAVTRTRLTVFGLISTRKYEELARSDFEKVSAGYKTERH